MERRSKPPVAHASSQSNIINLRVQQPGKPCNIRAGESLSTGAPQQTQRRDFGA